MDELQETNWGYRWKEPSQDTSISLETRCSQNIQSSEARRHGRHFLDFSGHHVYTCCSTDKVRHRHCRKFEKVCWIKQKTSLDVYYTGSKIFGKARLNAFNVELGQVRNHGDQCWSVGSQIRDILQWLQKQTVRSHDWIHKWKWKLIVAKRWNAFIRCAFQNKNHFESRKGDRDCLQKEIETHVHWWVEGVSSLSAWRHAYNKIIAAATVDHKVVSGSKRRRNFIQKHTQRIQTYWQRTRKRFILRIYFADKPV